MKVKRYIGGTLESNGYVVYNRSHGECYIIDPGYNPKNFIGFVEEKQLIPKGIILTHLHHDHTGKAEAVREALNCPIYMHEDDAFVYNGIVDERIKDGYVFDLEEEKLTAVLTRDTPKAAFVLWTAEAEYALRGDTIFDTDLGRSDLPGGSETDMKTTVCSIIDKWENDITIYPGHDGSCTMKQVRKYNEEFLALRDGNER